MVVSAYPLFDSFLYLSYYLSYVLCATGGRALETCERQDGRRKGFLRLDKYQAIASPNSLYQLNFIWELAFPSPAFISPHQLAAKREREEGMDEETHMKVLSLPTVGDKKKWKYHLFRFLLPFLPLGSSVRERSDPVPQTALSLQISLVKPKEPALSNLL